MNPLYFCSKLSNYYIMHLIVYTNKTVVKSHIYIMNKVRKGILTSGWTTLPRDLPLQVKLRHNFAVISLGDGPVHKIKRNLNKQCSGLISQHPRNYRTFVAAKGPSAARQQKFWKRHTSWYFLHSFPWSAHRTSSWQFHSHSSSAALHRRQRGKDPHW